MRNRPPATPEELRVNVKIYKKVLLGDKNDHGQDKYRYALRKEIKVKEARQRAGQNTQAHMVSELFISRFIGNWWEFLDIETSDIIVVINTRAQFGLSGPVVNWEQRNRWGVIDSFSDQQCRKAEGIDSCYCK